MDVADDTDGSLDPRIQIELENLNNATDDINKLETELDEAHTAFRQLLSDSTRRLKEIADKIGSGCIEKARCYYEALEVARQAQVQCQQQAQLFQRASEIHAAAKETVALAEARFMSHQHEWNFDQAWQDMLNHATLKVMDAENQKAECGREHHRRAMLFHDAEKKLLQLEEKHRRFIIKARPYFEVKAQCDQMLATQKERVECLQRAIKDAKKNYASSLRVLEDISNQIHQQRRDYDFVANGPREPGVGAELVSPERNSNYEADFDQLPSNRINSVTNNQVKKDSRTQEDVCEVKEDAEHLGKRSVDGSEATSSQWELELQVSMENLNNSSHESYDSDREIARSSDLHIHENENAKPINHEINNAQNPSSNFPQDGDFSMNTLNHFQKFSKNLQLLKKPLTGTSLISHFQGLNLSKSDSAASIEISKSKGSSKGYMSLTNSPVNTNASSFEAVKPAERAGEETRKYVPNKMSEFFFNNKKSRSNNDINLSWNLDINVVQKYQQLDNGSVKNNIADDKTDTHVAKAPCTGTRTLEEISEKNVMSETNLTSTRSTSNDNTLPCLQKAQPVPNKRPNIMHGVSHSASSTPVKLKSSLSTTPLNNKLTDDLEKYGVLKTLTSKKSSIKELPLLSLFNRTNTLATTKGKSCSMINLDDKQNLMILLDNSHLNNIQAVSAERLANARDNLFPKVPR